MRQKYLFLVIRFVFFPLQQAISKIWKYINTIELKISSLAEGGKKATVEILCNHLLARKLQIILNTLETVR